MINGGAHGAIEAKEIGLCKFDLNLVYLMLSLSLFATPPKPCLERAKTRPQLQEDTIQRVIGIICIDGNKKLLHISST